MIICKGWIVWMVICKGLPLNDHFQVADLQDAYLQETASSGFAKDWIIQMIIYKRLDLLGWSFARGGSFGWSNPQIDHLQGRKLWMGDDEGDGGVVYDNGQGWRGLTGLTGERVTGVMGAGECDLYGRWGDLKSAMKPRGLFIMILRVQWSQETCLWVWGGWLGGCQGSQGVKRVSKGSHRAIGLVWWVSSWFIRHICLYISDPDF